MRIVIDAGHGGRDPGAIYGNMREKDITLEAAEMLRDMLMDYEGVVVSMTRESDVDFYNGGTVANDLQHRMGYSTSGTALFLSLHVNAFSNEEAHGVEVYTGNAASYSALGNSIVKSISDKCHMFNRGLKTANYYQLTHGQASERLLVEMGFITNTEDRMYLHTDLEQIVEAILDAIVAHYDLKVVASVPEYQFPASAEWVKAAHISDGERATENLTRQEFWEMLYRFARYLSNNIAP